MEYDFSRVKFSADTPNNDVDEIVTDAKFDRLSWKSKHGRKYHTQGKFARKSYCHKYLKYHQKSLCRQTILFPDSIKLSPKYVKPDPKAAEAAKDQSAEGGDNEQQASRETLKENRYLFEKRYNRSLGFTPAVTNKGEPCDREETDIFRVSCLFSCYLNRKNIFS